MLRKTLIASLFLVSLVILACQAVEVPPEVPIEQFKSMAILTIEPAADNKNEADMLEDALHQAFENNRQQLQFALNAPQGSDLVSLIEGLKLTPDGYDQVGAATLGNGMGSEAYLVGTLEKAEIVLDDPVPAMEMVMDDATNEFVEVQKTSPAGVPMMEQEMNVRARLVLRLIQSSSGQQIWQKSYPQGTLSVASFTEEFEEGGEPAFPDEAEAIRQAMQQLARKAMQSFISHTEYR